MATYTTRTNIRVRETVLLSFIAIFLLSSLVGLIIIFASEVKTGCSEDEEKLCLISAAGNKCIVRGHHSTCKCNEDTHKNDDGPIASCIGIEECLYTRKRICKTHENIKNKCVLTGEEKNQHTCICDHEHYIRGYNWKSCVKEGRRIWQYFTEKKTWSSASESCINMGFDNLAVLNDNITYTAAFEYIPVNFTHGHHLRFHIGLSGQLISNDILTWTWVDGKLWTKRDFSLWAKGRPHLPGTHFLAMACVHMSFDKNGSRIQGIWKDESCTERVSYLCEKYTHPDI